MANPPHHRPLDFLADIVVVREHLGTEACPLAFRPAGVFAAAGLYIAYAEKMAEGKGFEPPEGVSSFNDLANRRLQPLGHPSAKNR